MLKSGKNKYSNSRVVRKKNSKRKKKILSEKKTHTPPAS